MTRRTAILISGVVAVVVLPLIGLTLMSLFSSRPTNLGIHDGRLAPCPNTPNCVCSQERDEEHAIEPFPLSGSRAEAIARLKTAIASFPRTQVIQETDNYLHAEFTSAIFRFTDDVEFFIDESARVIQVRSASRVGRSDLGANRERVEAIRKAFSADANDGNHETH